MTALLRAFQDALIADRVANRFAAMALEAKGTGRGWERRKEKDDFAEANIPPEHVSLWRKLKTQFKGTPHERVEQFMKYLEEHPGENDAWLQQNADKELAKVTREWEKKRRVQEKQEKDCDKNQTRYEDAWYKEQERSKQEKDKLKKLREKAEGVCESCTTCETGGGSGSKPEREEAYEPAGVPDDYYDEIPF